MSSFTPHQKLKLIESIIEYRDSDEDAWELVEKIKAILYLEVGK